MRPIDADALIKKCGEWYVEEGPEDGFIGTIKQLLESQPIVHVSEKDADTISRQAAIEDVGDGVYTGSKIRRWLKSLPSVQPNHCAEVGKKVLIDRQEALEKIRKMQTYKLFEGDDMILVDKAEMQTELMMLPSVQPERKGAVEKAVAVEAICDELMSRFDVSATYAYEAAESAVNRIEVMAKELERGDGKQDDT